MIIRYPDMILRKVCKSIKRFDTLKPIIDKMNLVMLINNGCGLAANQIGYNMNMFVACFEGKFYEIINPEIISENGFQYGEEGCLSSEDGEIIITKRPRKMKIKYQDSYGNNRKMSVRGKLAQIFSHEIDHLNGVYYKERKV